MKQFLILFILFFIILNSFSQTKPKKFLPAYQTKEEIIESSNHQITKSSNHQIIKSPNHQIIKSLNLVVPGEFEESQAVLIAWHYETTYASQANPLWAKLINAIQHECQVWILIDKYSDSLSVKNTLSANKCSLYNYKFIAKQTDAFWARDYGPWGFYYSDKDSLGFADLHYYTSRPNDDAVPLFLASRLKIPCYSSLIRMEGGNFMVDGFGNGFYSNRINSNNTTYNGWNYNQTNDTIKHVFNLNSNNVMTALSCDGGTGHIDMYSKLMDEQTIVITQYPASVTASDKATIENNVKIYQGLKSVYNRPYRIFRAPMPTGNNGSYYTTCSQIDADARGYTNGVFVNKSYIMPCFSSASSGNVKSDSDAVKFFRKVIPGYKIVPIDSRLLTPWGGAIHCITMQIPANNPIRFWHPSIDDAQNYLDKYHIIAKIKNRDGIDTALCFWRYKDYEKWNRVVLSDSTGYFTGNINNTSLNMTDTIQYYLYAKSHNGKSMTKPITAPQGYYTFYYTSLSSFIKGTVTYDNKSSSVISNATVYLTNSENNNIITSAKTDMSGNYTLKDIKNGTYKLYATSIREWNGGDPVDALLINKYYINLYSFKDNLTHLAADVNTDNLVNSTDAFLVNKRYLGTVTSFAAGDWISETHTITIQNNNIRQNIKIVCTGDINTSLKP